MALDPNFPTRPYVYVLYSYDDVLGDSAPAPRWGTPGVTSDPCPTPPGPTTDGCVTERSHFAAPGGWERDDRIGTGARRGLVRPVPDALDRHGRVRADGALYASGGDGAERRRRRLRTEGSPVNPCGDPPGGVGAVLTPPTAEGGALRSQDLRTTGDPDERSTGRSSGSILRRGLHSPRTRWLRSSDANARRIIAYGLRNPFRFAFRPGTNEIWVGDVGWIRLGGDQHDRESRPTRGRELRLAVLRGSESPGRLRRGESQHLREPLRDTERRDEPVLRLQPRQQGRHRRVVPDGQLIDLGNGVRVRADERSYPACVPGRAVLRRLLAQLHLGDEEGRERRSRERALSRRSIADASSPVDLEFGPGGDLYYVDLNGGTIRRITYSRRRERPPAGTTYLCDLELDVDDERLGAGREGQEQR